MHYIFNNLIHSFHITYFNIIISISSQNIKNYITILEFIAINTFLSSNFIHLKIAVSYYDSQALSFAYILVLCLLIYFYCISVNQNHVAGRRFYSIPKRTFLFSSSLIFNYSKTYLLNLKILFKQSSAIMHLTMAVFHINYYRNQLFTYYSFPSIDQQSPDLNNEYFITLFA